MQAATFDRMRERADEIVPESTHAIWHDNKQFFHRGTTAQWRTHFDQFDADRYRARVRPLADPDLLAWVHRTDW